MAEYEVIDGVTSSGITLEQGDIMYVSGATAINTTINQKGIMDIDEGGYASNTTVTQGYMYVLEGGTADIVTVNLGGKLAVSGGGTATRILENGGYVDVLPGTTVTFVPNVLSGLVFKDDVDPTIHSGTTGIDLTLNSNGRLYVRSGGITSNTTVNNDGEMRVSIGGTATDTTVNTSGHLYVYFGGTAINNSVYDGYMDVSCGTASNTTVVGGRMNALSGGTAINNSVYDGGYMDVYSGGITSNTTVNYDCSMYVYGGTAINTTVNSKGILDVSGGTATDTTVNPHGNLYVSSGGTATNTRVESEGGLVVFSGGTAANVNVAGGVLHVLPGGKVTGKIRIRNQVVSAGDGAILDFDLTQTAPGAYALVDDFSRALPQKFTYTLTVSDTQVDGTYELAAGAAGFDKTITVMNPLGEAFGTISVTGGTQTAGKRKYTLSLDDSILSVTVARIPDMTGDLTSSASLTSGMYASGLIVSGRTMKRASLLVSSGGLASMTTVIRSSFLDVSSGGMVDNTTVSSGGTMTVFSGGVANHTSVFSSGSMYISSGGSVSDITVLFIGTVNIGEGVAVDTVTVSTGGLVNVYGGAVSNATVSSGGRMWVGRGSATDTMVSSKGLMSIGSGCEVRNTTVSAGSMFVRSGASASRTTVSGSVIVSGTATDNTVYFNGCLDICNGGLASNTTIKYYGISYVSSGGTAADVTIENDGDLFVLDGGKVTGKITLKNDAGFYLTTGSILDFDISGVGPENDPFVNDFSLVQYAATDMSMPVTPTYTLTVSGTQANGKYKLAGGAAGFDKTITLVNTLGESLGSLTLAGGTQTIGGVDYTLNLGGDNVLSVTVGAALPDPGPDSKLFFAGDFDNGGRALLAVEKDGAVKIYSNGAEWGSGLALDPGWEVVGVGDFNADKKDDFLRVNTEGYVVGEMSQGDGTFAAQVLNLKSAGWSILGTGDFNGNGSDDVLIANPTAASETVGLLGYWESGVTWTLINGYSAEWKMVSTGDFNGDGKCDMLWKNEFIGAGDLTYNAYCTWIVEDPVDWRMVSVANPAEWNFLCSGDFDGNGSHDIAMINDVGVVGIWGVGDGYLNSWSILSAVDPSAWALAGVGDFNGDGTDDIAWSNTDTGLTGYWQINNKELTTWANIATLQAV